MNRNQFLSIRRLHRQYGQPPSSIQPMLFGGGALVAGWPFIWIAVETDGYAHS